MLSTAGSILAISNDIENYMDVHGERLRARVFVMLCAKTSTFILPMISSPAG